MPRKIGFSIGRVTNVPSGRGEDYYLRLLLNFQRGCTCYDDLRKVEDHVYPTFKDACFALGLLDDDKEYIAGIKEANEWASGDYVRRLFVVLLVANNMSRPEHVWECCWKEFVEDIAYRLQQRRTNSGPHVSDDTLRNYALIEIENILQSNSTSLSNFPPMPIPIGSMTDGTVNRLVLDELDYDVDAMCKENKYLSSITDEQKKMFDDIMDVVTNDRGELFFLYGHGGTGKTFIWKTLSAAIRSKGEIVINVASSGIASLLLPGGRTAHSRLGLPIIVHESSTCNIKHQSPHAELLSRAKLIIWDEAPMMHRYCFEALDKTMKSILDSDMPFGGKVVVLGGDSLQILSVVLKASRQDIVHATMNSSPLWRQCKVMKLNKNMRLQSSSSSANADEIREFTDWILRIRNDDAGEINDGDATNESIGFVNDHFFVDHNWRGEGLFQLSHGQLYVALSRVKSRSGIKILINSESGDTTNVTNNVVYKEVFQRI
ncbi:PREDICTED: uncharacterized protein LOC105972659 [Erythranthe guttata]|uniref:uncharacterized protein LOC105972659 n=1 Tax=Erythranthe guttata TaxID=4155 RepID=UPI00064DBF83|nr:PREDICTED: uncharacterized protein LOC105972659 [Erythranthe guttata]|eukprot:XP_012853090.1 PREDICTED: uncharacterized protein LOC105972659 [Erythranthe guttata]